MLRQIVKYQKPRNNRRTEQTARDKLRRYLGPRQRAGRVLRIEDWQEMVDEHYACRFCFIARNDNLSRGTHNSSECPSLPSDPLELYILIANRLTIVRRFGKLVRAGHHAPIVTPRGTLGPQLDNSRATLPAAALTPQQTQSMLRQTQDAAQGYKKN